MNSAQLIAYLLLRLIQKHPGSFYRAYLAKNNNPCVFDILVATFVLAEQISSRVGRPPHQNWPVEAQVKLFSSTKKTWFSVRGETRPNSTGENLAQFKWSDHILHPKHYVSFAWFIYVLSYIMWFRLKGHPDLILWMTCTTSFIFSNMVKLGLTSALVIFHR